MALSAQSQPCQDKLSLRRVFIAHGQGEEERKFAREYLKPALEREKFEVLVSDSTDRNDLASAVKKSRKVIMLISRDYLGSEEYTIVLDYVERMTSTSHIECLIPLLLGLEPEDLPEQLRTGDAVPVCGPASDYLATKDNSHLWAKLVGKLHEEVPVLSTSTDGVAFGLAWGYYCGYLYWILPKLRERIESEYSSSRHDWECGDNATLFPKLVAIIPKKRQAIVGNCERKTSLSDYDENIQIVTSRENGDPIKIKFTVDFPGHPHKCYSLALHKLTANGKEYIFCAEIPTTLNTLAIMGDPTFNCVDFSEEAYEREIERFISRVAMVLKKHVPEASPSMRDSFKMLPYGEGDVLSERIADGIERDIAWENEPWKI